eukprot:SAG11_NODE_9635_length_893_cov_1.730479_1_plen_83_part_00
MPYAGLFNVFVDPTEKDDLALTMPSKVTEILGRMRELEPSAYDPYRGEADAEGACAMVVERDGYWGPWLNLSVDKGTKFWPK